MNRRKQNVTQLLLLASTLAAFAACGQNEPARAPSPTALPTASVQVQKVDAQSAPFVEEVTGVVRAKIRATLESKQPGRIERITKALGDRVLAGELLVQIHAPETAARLEQAEASLEQAERDWKRIDTLFGQSSATRAERDASEARVRSARAAASEAQAWLAHARIVAPFDGAVARKWADAGDLAAPGKPILDLEDPRFLQVEIDVPEGLAGGLKEGMELPIVGSSGAAILGTVKELAPSLDSVTRTRRVRLSLPDGGSLASGQFVRVSIPRGERRTLVVPAAAVIERGQLEIAFTVEDQRARLRLVKTGARTPASVEILAGLRPGDDLVVHGAAQLADGQPVEIK